MLAPLALPRGPLGIDLAGTALTEPERERLCHPGVGAVVLFTRNYCAPEQLRELVSSIKALRDPPLLVTVDHEGGRVQRFREGFTRIPAAASLGRLHDRAPAAALEHARDAGLVMAAELRAVGVDLSFAPVLDLDHTRSSVIGERAFHADPNVVAALAGAFVDGMAEAGMAAVGKHFPGHGAVAGDSHLELPEDERDWAVIAARDLVPFARLTPRLGGVMPAHVRYPSIAPEPAGFSEHWLQGVLRRRLGFSGCIVTDDLAMAGARGVGGPRARLAAALTAGCDVGLICNAVAEADGMLDALGRGSVPSGEAWGRLAPRPHSVDRAALDAARARLATV